MQDTDVSGVCVCAVQIEGTLPAPKQGIEYDVSLCVVGDINGRNKRIVFVGLRLFICAIVEIEKENENSEAMRWMVNGCS